MPRLRKYPRTNRVSISNFKVNLKSRKQLHTHYLAYMQSGEEFKCLMPCFAKKKKKRPEVLHQRLAIEWAVFNLTRPPQLAQNINGPKVSHSLFSFPLKRIMSKKMQPTEEQILTANPVVGIPDLIYCPDVLHSRWQEHPRPCPGPHSLLLRAAHQISHPLPTPLNSCFLLALRAM